MTQQEIDSLLTHLLTHFSNIDDGDFDPDLALGWLFFAIEQFQQG